jgi:hypothetical protein
MQQQKCAGRRIEGIVRERQLGRVAVHELDTWRAGARELEHRLGEVDTDGLRAPLGSSGRDVARPRGDVEHSLARLGTDRIEERIGQARGHPAGQRVVAGCLLRSPPGRLEGVKRHRVVVAHRRQYAPTRRV